MRFRNNDIITNIAITFFLNILATALSLFLQHLGFTEVNFVVIYILSVLIISRYTKGYFYGIAASVISMLSFNFFFTDPLYSFSVDDPSYVFTFAVILFAAIFTSAITSKLIHSKDLANEREKQSQTLYQVTSSLAKAGGVENVAIVSVQCLVDLFKSDIIFITINHKDNTVKEFAPALSGYGIISRSINLKNVEIIKNNHFSFPIIVRDKCEGYICFPEKFKDNKENNLFLLNSVIMQITSAIQREILTTEKENAKAETERERLRGNLLRAISHDLRTPLTGIMGSAEMLLQRLSDKENIKLLQDIFEESGWLIRLVENILSLTKIQEGRLALTIQPEVAEEIAAEAVSRASKYTSDHKISISVPEEPLFIPMDGKLIIQVLINLLDNAIKHTISSEDIAVSVRIDKEKAWFEVIDGGTGINENDMPKIFDIFFTARNSHIDAKHGIGLGLAICKAIVNLHGGEIFVENNKIKGSTFRFYLNLKNEKERIR